MGKEKSEIDKTTLWVSLREGVDGSDDVEPEPTIQPDVTIDVPDHNITHHKRGDRVAHRVIAWYKLRDGKIAGLKGVSTRWAQAQANVDMFAVVL